MLAKSIRISCVDISDRFPPVSIAEEAIKTIREAIHDIYERMGKQSPAWVDFDEAKGWPIGGSFGFATLTAVGADPNDPNTLRIALVAEDGAEKVTNTFPGTIPEEDVFGHVEDLLGRLNAPFREVRVYPASCRTDPRGGNASSLNPRTPGTRLGCPGRCAFPRPISSLPKNGSMI